MYISKRAKILNKIMKLVNKLAAGPRWDELPEGFSFQDKTEADIWKALMEGETSKDAREPEATAKPISTRSMEAKYDLFESLAKRLKDGFKDVENKYFKWVSKGTTPQWPINHELRDSIHGEVRGEVLFGFPQEDMDDVKIEMHANKLAINARPRLEDILEYKTMGGMGMDMTLDIGQEDELAEAVDEVEEFIYLLNSGA